MTKKRLLVLLTPFAAALLLLTLGLLLYYRGRSDEHHDNGLAGAGEALVYFGVAALIVGVVLATVYGLARFVRWAGSDTKRESEG